ncbi:MAG: tetratricopeptide repeat protein [bacterium]
MLEIKDSPFIQNLMSDSKIYYNWASSIVDTGSWLGDDAFFMAPIYPYTLAVIFALVGKSILIIQLLQAIISSLTILLTYFIGKNFHSRAVGYVASIISSAYLLYIFYAGMVLSETFQTFIVASLLFFLSRDQKKISNAQWFVIGLLLGVTALFRANVLFFLLVLTIWLIIKYFRKKVNIVISIRQFLLLLIGAFIVISPVAFRNYMVSKELVLLTTNGGINFYIGNNLSSPGVFVTPTDFDFAKDLAGKQFAEKQSGKKLSSSEASSFWYNQAFQEMSKNPGRTLILYFKKLFLFFGGSENPQSTIMDPSYFSENYPNLLQAPLFGFTFISFLFVFGVYFSIKNAVRRPLLLIFLFSFIMSTILFFVNGRFRLAIAPLMIVYASYGIVEIFTKLQEVKFKEFLVPSVILIVFIAFYYFIIDRPTFTSYDAYQHLGDVDYEKGEFEKAIENYNRSLFYRDDYITYMNLGNAYARKEDYKSAIAAYNRALSRKPNDLLTHFNLASALTQMGKMDEGLKEFKKVLEYDPNYANAYRNIGIIYYVSEQYENALAYFNKFLTLSTDAEINDYVRQDIENINRKLQYNTKKAK